MNQLGTYHLPISTSMPQPSAHVGQDKRAKKSVWEDLPSSHAFSSVVENLSNLTTSLNHQGDLYQALSTRLDNLQFRNKENIEGKIFLIESRLSEIEKGMAPTATVQADSVEILSQRISVLEKEAADLKQQHQSSSQEHLRKTVHDTGASSSLHVLPAAVSKNLKEEIVRDILEHLCNVAIPPIVGIEVTKQLDQSQIREEKSSSPMEIDENPKCDQNDQAIVALSESLARCLEQELEREIEGTVWEALVLAFHHTHLSLWDSATIVFAGVLNILVQLLFVYVLQRSFLEPELPDLEEVRNWRKIYGHDSRYYLTAPQSSLVSAVCSLDESLIFSTAQQGLLATIQDYLADPFGVPLGAVLCILVLFLWALLIGQEVALSLTFLASLALIIGKTTVISALPGSERAFEFTCVGTRRFVFACFVTGLRLFVCTSLLIEGSQWLSNTVNIQDIVLNGAALCFILDVDELLFSSFISIQVRALINNLQPFQRPPRYLWIAPVGLLLGSTALTIVMSAEKVSPNVDSMDLIWEIMCDGDKDFIVGEGAVGIQMAYRTKPFDPEATTFAMGLVEEMWQTDYSAGLNVRPSYNLFQTATGYSTDPKGYIDLYQRVYSKTCEDMYTDGLTLEHPYLLESVRYLTGLADMTKCSHAIDFCGYDGYNLLRLLCPEICGCSNPLSGLYREGKDSGCAVETCHASKGYQATLDSLPCADMNISMLQASPGWARFWKEVLWFKGKSQQKLATWEAVRNDFNSTGCAKISEIDAKTAEQLCQKGPSSGALLSYCPVSCGCNKTDSYAQGCPTACLAST